MYSRLPGLAFVAALLCSSASAVTLDDFTPRLTDLTGECEKLYTTSIDGCQGSDFSNQKCSSDCVSALLSLGTLVKKSCTGQGKAGSIVAAFLNGQGVSQLCPNVADATASAETTTKSHTMAIGTSTLVLSSTSFSTTGIIVDTGSMSSPTSTTSKAHSSTLASAAVTVLSTAPQPQQADSVISTTSTVTGSALAFDTNTPSDVATETAFLTSTTSSSDTAHAAKETESSKSGGSPFDDTSDASRHDPTIKWCTVVLTVLLVQIGF